MASAMMSSGAAAETTEQRWPGFFGASLAEVDPDLVGRGPGRARPRAARDRADRQREHRQPGRARGAGLGADQQVRRRLSRASATMAAASMSTSPRRWRSSAPSACSTAASPTSSRIPAPRPTVPSSWRCSARRHHPRHVARRRRPSHPRRQARHVRQVVQGGAVRRARGGRADRLSTRSSGWRTSTSRS